MITFFKSITDTANPTYLSVDEAIDRTRSGVSKTIIEGIRSYPDDKPKRNALKKQLPCLCFSGEFTKREASSIVSHSGFICIDFDGFEDEWALADYRFFLENDRYSYSVFTSPSGDGIKVIVKIPPVIENHKGYFLALQKYYNVSEFDTSCKDIGRVCYESYDPDVYVNKESELWTELFEEPKYVPVQRDLTIKLDNDNEVIRRLLVWWNKDFGMVDGVKNNNLFVLCAALNEYGIPESEALYTAINLAGSDKETEVTLIVKSAYSNTTAHGIKFYEDTVKVDAIKKLVKNGAPIDQVVAVNKKIDPVVVKAIAEKIEVEPLVFWHRSDKGVISHVNHLYKQYLESMGYGKFYLEDGQAHVFVEINNNIISDASEDTIKDRVLEYLYDMEDKTVYNYFADKSKLFKEDHLSFLKTIKPVIMADTDKCAHLYFNNCLVRVTKDNVETFDYSEIDSYIWDKQRIKRDFYPSDFSDAIFKQFISNISGSDAERIKSIESTAGYLLHSYKPPSESPAVIINDEVISDNPEGGTGKGIFVASISHLKRGVIIDGKAFSFTKSFPYQRVSADTQTLVFDDVSRNFDFEKLFSIITEGITLEKKNKDEIQIPFSRSPKIVITTNYAIKGAGNSHDRRKWEIELAQHYHKDHTPEHEFGHQLFTQWDDCEWNKFDNYMISNIQLYLSKGLVKSKFKNLKERKFIASTSMDFHDWVMDKYNVFNKLDIDYIGADMFNNFTEQNPDYGLRGRFTLPHKKFYQWIDLMGQYLFNSSPITSRGSNGKTIRFIDRNNEQIKMKI
jgi:hypothetical protein